MSNDYECRHCVCMSNIAACLWKTKVFSMYRYCMNTRDTAPYRGNALRIRSDHVSTIMTVFRLKPALAIDCNRLPPPTTPFSVALQVIPKKPFMPHVFGIRAAAALLVRMTSPLMMHNS